MTTKEVLEKKIEERRNKFVTKEDCKRFEDQIFNFLVNSLGIAVYELEILSNRCNVNEIDEILLIASMRFISENLSNKVESIFKNCNSKEFIVFILKTEFKDFVNKFNENKKYTEELKYLSFLKLFIKTTDANSAIDCYINMFKYYFTGIKNIKVKQDLIYSLFIIYMIYKEKTNEFLKEQEVLKSVIDYIERCIKEDREIDSKMLCASEYLQYFAQENVISLADSLIPYIIPYNNEIKEREYMINSNLNAEKNELVNFSDAVKTISYFHEQQICELINNIIMYGDKHLYEDVQFLLLNRDADKKLLVTETINRLKNQNINHNTNKALIVLNNILKEIINESHNVKSYKKKGK